DVVVASALIDMYVKNESIIDARKVFNNMSTRNVISWNSMIVGYGQCNDNICPDELTLASVFSSCGDLSLHSEIIQLHSFVFKTGSVSFKSVSNALVNAYSKTGNIASALKSFNSIERPDIVSYTSMIQAYAFHGFSRNAIELFNKMILKSVPKPDKILFLGVLSACSHGGLVSEGLHYFESMTKDYNILPELEHYTCLVDLLGRAGLLNDAFNVLVSMSMPPAPDTLGAFIGHCTVYKHTDLAKWASEKLFVLEPNKNVNYALMSNTFAHSGKCDADNVNMPLSIQDDTKSQTGYVFVVNRGAVDWKSKKQTTIAMHSAQAEYVAALKAAMEAVWIRKFVRDLGGMPSINKPINMYCDNSVAIIFANEPGIMKGAIHFLRRYHYVREQVETGEIKLIKVHTDDNLADPFT
nr:hypothetical protein [Tanacetum cinerariifolium]